ncbi:uncharacterized protein K444DRAFT_300450 [Hyaloscypha bicolor E]|uniref:Phospholipase D-like domain-containing protein n=1 Tax=Hyaloscypha bicolor E TaxID=1095630 RepID=A0A2J6SFD7_9HELO|nr:uncharacterized protein K444DRAFT_300450 [Hyaloscypha bicolor E]PMD49466.1 hypothetical protein K444DRAFT_300450 [Hyaloscypha bicolor E]
MSSLITGKPNPVSTNPDNLRNFLETDSDNLKSRLFAELDHTDLKTLDIICAYVQTSGVVRLRKFFEQLQEMAVKVRIITTLQMGTTELAALETLKRFNNIDIKVFNYPSDRRLTFHAKAWLFRYLDGHATAIVGSSNISRSALLSGIEWNLVLANQSPETNQTIQFFTVSFQEYWYETDVRFRGNLIEYSDATRKHLDAIHQNECTNIDIDIDANETDPAIRKAVEELRDAQKVLQAKKSACMKLMSKRSKRPLQAESETRPERKKPKRAEMAQTHSQHNQQSGEGLDQMIPQQSGLQMQTTLPQFETASSDTMDGSDFWLDDNPDAPAGLDNATFHNLSLHSNEELESHFPPNQTIEDSRTQMDSDTEVNEILLSLSTLVRDWDRMIRQGAKYKIFPGFLVSARRHIEKLIDTGKVGEPSQFKD